MVCSNNTSDDSTHGHHQMVNTEYGVRHKKDNTNRKQPSKETYGPCAPDTYTRDDL